MHFVAKTAPVSAQVGDTVQIEERAMYGGGAITPGAAVFLWASETQGGPGLWARGIALSAGRGAAKLNVTVRVEQVVNSRNFGIEQIAPHRDSADGSAIAGLARKLYRHAHNKIAKITEPEASLLQQQFG